MSTAPRIDREDFERDVMLIDEVAEYLRLDYATHDEEPSRNAIRMRVYRLVRTQGLTAHRIGGKIRFLREEVRQWASASPRV